MDNSRKYASVFVDVPTDKTDRPFDYEIPPNLEEHVQVGCRVRVPFRSRTVQGYVVQIHKQPEVENVRPIEEVVDVQPPLNEELIDLAHWMSDYYFCRTVSALELMIPAVLKARYEKVLRLGPEGGNDGIGTPSERQLFDEIEKRGGTLSLNQAELIPGVTTALIQKLVQEQRLVIDVSISDRTTHKKVTWVRPASPQSLREELAVISKRAFKQREILEFFLERPEPVKLSELLKAVKTTRSTVQQLVNRGILYFDEKTEFRNPYEQPVKPDHPPELTSEQAKALEQIVEQLHKKEEGMYLLHGVTGSGKTEVYLHAIDATLKQGREAIVLVPEIALTPQMVERFKGRFGDRVAVLHSHLSAGERYDEWRKVLYGNVQVVIGARSAIFAPFRQLGLIIIDEEHESTYKQEESPRYHVRDIAKKRAQYHQAVVVLGSATPSVETFYRAKTGEMTYLSLEKRVHGRPLPTVSVVDMRQELDRGNRSMFSRALSRSLLECVERGEQAILFLNRRGYSTFVLCRSCGTTIQCPHCDISLTYHRTNERMQCHYCGYAETVPINCPECNSEHIRYFGTGTQRVEQELARLFPGLRVTRMDVDTTRQKGAHERLLTTFREGRSDVLLGTQMIAKGLDFPGVTLVGIIAADTTLGLPDFRAGERTFQLLMQVGGRAGRHERPGQVIIQTYNPDHYSIQMAANYDVLSFYRKESLIRKRNQYPPFCSLIAIRFSHPDPTVVMKTSHELTKIVQAHLHHDVSVLGPVKAPIFRVKDRYHMQTVIKYKGDHGLKQAIQALIAARNTMIGAEGLYVTIDRDPYTLY